MIQWCCLTFRSWFNAAGERGFAIVVDKDSLEKPQFLIQHRAVDMNIESLPITDFPLTVVSQIYIDYCPFCGRNSEKQYGKHVEKLYKKGLKIN